MRKEYITVLSLPAPGIGRQDSMARWGVFFNGFEASGLLEWSFKRRHYAPKEECVEVDPLVELSQNRQDVEL